MRGVRFMLALAIAWGMQAGVSYAESNWWDHLSGPGPYWGVFLDYRFGCFASVPRADRPDQQQTAFTFLSPSDRTALPWVRKRAAPARLSSGEPGALAANRCKRDELHDALYLELRWDQSYSNQLTPRNSEGEEARVRIVGLEFGHLRRLTRGWSLRTTAGINRFSGDQFTTFYKPSNTIALEFAPYAVDDASASRWIKIIAGATILYGGFESSAFCNRIDTNPQCRDIRPQHFGTEAIPTVSIVIDPSLRP